MADNNAASSQWTVINESGTVSEVDVDTDNSTVSDYVNLGASEVEFCKGIERESKVEDIGSIENGDKDNKQINDEDNNPANADYEIKLATENATVASPLLSGQANGCNDEGHLANSDGEESVGTSSDNETQAKGPDKIPIPGQPKFEDLDSESDHSDFVRLEEEPMEVSTSSSCSVHANFRFLPQTAKINNEDQDERCESDLIGIDQSDLSYQMHGLGDIPLTPGPRSYRHQPNPSLNFWLTALALAVLSVTVGFAMAHYVQTVKLMYRNQKLEMLREELVKVRGHHILGKEWPHSCNFARCFKGFADHVIGQHEGAVTINGSLETLKRQLAEESERQRKLLSQQRLEQSMHAREIENLRQEIEKWKVQNQEMKLLFVEKSLSSSSSKDPVETQHMYSSQVPENILWERHDQNLGSEKSAPSQAEKSAPSQAEKSAPSQAEKSSEAENRLILSDFLDQIKAFTLEMKQILNNSRENFVQKINDRLDIVEKIMKFNESNSSQPEVHQAKAEPSKKNIVTDDESNHPNFAEIFRTNFQQGARKIRETIKITREKFQDNARKIKKHVQESLKLSHFGLKEEAESIGAHVKKQSKKVKDKILDTSKKMWAKGKLMLNNLKSVLYKKNKPSLEAKAEHKKKVTPEHSEYWLGPSVLRLLSLDMDPTTRSGLQILVEELAAGNYDRNLMEELEEEVEDNMEEVPYHSHDHKALKDLHSWLSCQQHWWKHRSNSQKLPKVVERCPKHLDDLIGWQRKETCSKKHMKDYCFKVNNHLSEFANHDQSVDDDDVWLEDSSPTWLWKKAQDLQDRQHSSDWQFMRSNDRELQREQSIDG